MFRIKYPFPLNSQTGFSSRVDVSQYHFNFIRTIGAFLQFYRPFVALLDSIGKMFLENTTLVSMDYAQGNPKQRRVRSIIF